MNGSRFQNYMFINVQCLLAFIEHRLLTADKFTLSIVFGLQLYLLHCFVFLLPSLIIYVPVIKVNVFAILQVLIL
jgi:hypothetical protein